MRLRGGDRRFVRLRTRRNAAPARKKQRARATTHAGSLSPRRHAYAQGFDPLLIVAQIGSMQALWYLDYGFWVFLLNALSGKPVNAVGLHHLLSHEAVRITPYVGGWITIVAALLNALAGAAFLCVVVERAKKCLDFTVTAHFMHLCSCSLYDGLPDHWEWWAVNGMSVVLMALLGEYLACGASSRTSRSSAASRERSARRG